jgi:hypothetical protein
MTYGNACDGGGRACAAQLFLLINGAYAAGQISSDTDLPSTLIDAAHSLISSPMRTSVFTPASSDTNHPAS